MTLPVGAVEKGFSLVELLLVLSLLGLASLFVLPFLGRSLEERELTSSALELAALARRLRSQAISQGIPQRLVLDAQGNSYGVGGGNIVTLPRDFQLIRLEGGEPLGDGAFQVLFFPNGSSLGATVRIAGRRGRFYTVLFDRLSGRIRVRRGQGS